MHFHFSDLPLLKNVFGTVLFFLKVYSELDSILLLLLTIVATCLLVVELLVPGTFVFLFLAEFLYLFVFMHLFRIPLSVQIALPFFVSLATLCLVYHRTRGNKLDAYPHTNTDKLVNLQVIATVDFNQHSHMGYVMAERELWSAKSIDGRPVVKGQRLIVVAVDGNKLLVNAQ